MAVKGCLACVRYLVILINFLFWLAGIAVLAISVWLYLDTSAYLVSENSTKFFISIYILMAVGGLMILVGFLGCCGASQESPCMLGSFSFLVLMILAAEIGGAAYAYTHKDEVKKLLVDGIEDMINNEYGIQKATTAAVDAMQKKLECCGAKGYEDWSKAAINNPESKGFVEKLVGKVAFNIPQSCCSSADNEACSKASVIPFLNIDVYNEGCIYKLEKKIESHLSIIIAVGVGIAVLQILSFIFSLALCCAVNRPSSY